MRNMHETAAGDVESITKSWEQAMATIEILDEGGWLVELGQCQYGHNGSRILACDDYVMSPAHVTCREHAE